LKWLHLCGGARRACQANLKAMTTCNYATTLQPRRMLAMSRAAAKLRLRVWCRPKTFVTVTNSVVSYAAGIAAATAVFPDSAEEMTRD
jgi:hypothetical protein